LAEVVEPRYDELFTLVQAELRRSGFEDLCAAGVVLTGGSSKMEGAVELAEEIFHMPVRLAVPQGIAGLTDIVSNPIYSTGVGLLMYALKREGNRGSRQHSQREENLWWDKVKHWFRGNL
jgi:cell division protein FtsA